MSTNRGKRKASLVEIADTHMAKSCVFLAYANADVERVMELYQQLKDYGLDPWMDKYDLLPGQLWKEEIEIAIRSSRFFLACLSKHSADASFFSTELRVALEVYEQMPRGQVYLIPIRLDGSRLPDVSVGDIPLSDLQWVDLFDPDGFERLLRTLLSQQSLVDIGNDFFLTPLGRSIVLPIEYGNASLNLDEDLVRNVSQTLFHYNYVSFYAAIGLPFFFVLSVLETNIKRRFIYIGITLIMVFNQFASLSRNGFVGIIIAFSFKIQAINTGLGSEFLSASGGHNPEAQLVDMVLTVLIIGGGTKSVKKIAKQFSATQQAVQNLKK